MPIGKAEIPDHALHDEKLLVVLLSEHGDIGQALEEELRHDGGDACKEMRPGNTFQSLRQPRDLDPRCEIVRVNLVHLGSIHRVRLHAQKLVPVALLVAGVAVIVLVGGELRGVHEDGDDDAVCVPLRELDEREMPVMKAAHGRDERHPLPAAAPLLHRLAQLACKSNDR